MEAKGLIDLKSQELFEYLIGLTPGSRGPVEVGKVICISVGKKDTILAGG